jgi:hypothetical protein
VRGKGGSGREDEEKGRERVKFKKKWFEYSFSLGGEAF